MMGSLRFAALLAGVACGSCTPSPAPIVPGPPSNQDAFGGVACNAVRPQTEPDLMGWDSGSRANLNRLRREGVVVVRYEARGCNVELEVLSHCVVTNAQYKYSPYAAKETKVARDANELFAQLPLGAASLSGRMKGKRALRTDYILVGTSSLPASTSIVREELRGNGCERATHVVSAVYVGGFAIAAGEDQQISAAASIFSAGVGATVDHAAERVAFEGTPSACEKSLNDGTELPLCSVPLRIALLPLSPTPAAPAAVAPPNPSPGITPPPSSATPSPAVPASSKVADTPPRAARSFLSEESQLIVDTMEETKSVRVRRAPDGSAETVHIPLKVLFRDAEAELSTAGRKAATAFGELLKRSPNVDAELIGHADAERDDAANLRLSLARAKTVTTALAAAGIAQSRLKSGGRGAAEPLEPRASEQGKIWNQRIELVLRPRANVAAAAPAPAASGSACATFGGDYTNAMRAKDYACVRVILLPRLNSGGISSPEARYLKAACLALGDAACEKRAASKL